MKIFSWFSRITLSVFLLIGVASAASGDLWSWMDTLSDSIPFGYTLSQKISVTQITPAKVVFSSPPIQDELGNRIKKYTVSYSEYSLAKILENPSLLEQSKDKNFDFPVVNGNLTMELTASGDLLDPNKVYYVFIIPKDQNNIIGQISNELWIKL